MPEEQQPENNQVPPPPPPAVDPDVEKMRRQLATVAEENVRLRTAMQTSQSQPQPTNNQPRTPEDLKREFFTNPLGSTATVADAIINQRMQEMGRATYDTNREMARRMAREGHEELWDRYVAEIDAAVAEVHPFYHTNVNVWNMARDKVFGTHITEIRNAAIEASKKAPGVRISQGSGPAPASGKQPSADQGEHFSPDPVLTELGPVYEKEVATKLGLTEEQYVAGKKHIAGQSVRGASSWDPYITFDSRQRRRDARKAAMAKGAK